VTILELLSELGHLLGIEPEPRFDLPRAGDVRRSQADVSAATRDLGFRSETNLTEGLAHTLAWFEAWRRSVDPAVA
jgi:nucleoside-diphosphate-sugar epimerase